MQKWEWGKRERKGSEHMGGVGGKGASFTYHKPQISETHLVLSGDLITHRAGIPRLVQTKQSPLYTYKHITSLVTCCISSNYHRMDQSKFSICTHRTFLSNENGQNCAADIQPKAMCCLSKYK